MRRLRSQAIAGDLPALLRAVVPVNSRVLAREDRGLLARRLAGVSELEHEGIVLELVRGQVALVLGHPSPESIGAQRLFKDLGFDSLTAVELRNRLIAATGTQLPATLIFDYPTPAALATHILAGFAGVTQAAHVPAAAELDRLSPKLLSITNSLERAKVAARLQTSHLGIERWSRRWRGRQRSDHRHR